MHTKACVLTIDLRNCTLVDVAEFDTERQPGVPALYCLSTISKYMNVETSQVCNLLYYHLQKHALLTTPF